MTFPVLALLAAITVGTWNGEWFPSGRAEHRASDKVESAAIEAAGEMVASAVRKHDPQLTNDIILVFNEIRDVDVANRLAAASGITNLHVAVVSAYRRRDRFDQQQDVIMTTLPVVEASWSRWRTHKQATPPRGYAHAMLELSPGVTGVVYAVHLKSNYGQKTAEDIQLNRDKRAFAIEQLVEQERPKRGRPEYHVIIAGDFNADSLSDEGRDERMFSLLADAGFCSSVSLFPINDRFTHPGKGRYRSTTIDYIYYRGFDSVGKPLIQISNRLSDHDMPVIFLSPH